ncbi:MAG: polysaccharide deacetylase family protein [Bacteroidales bacterium]|nr:polysaccharide deacetylase family protein [Bacteroidales bacterium]
MKPLFRILLFSALIILLQSASFAQQKKVCFTIDDLPLQRPGWYDQKGQLKITDGILSALKLYQIPAIGFVNEESLYIDDKLNPARKHLLERWLQEGMELGNHTYSHPSYNNTNLAEFAEEIQKGQLVCDELCKTYNRPIRYFRHPFLNRGNTQPKVDSLAAYLKSIGLIEAPVTIDNSEWIFAFAYDSACNAKNETLKDSLAKDYIIYMEQKLHWFEDMSQKLFNRNISHVMLCHANALCADHLKDLAAMYKRNGYSFVTLEEVLKDEAYLSEDHYYGRSGISWIDRWAMTRGFKGDFFKGEPDCPVYVKMLAKVSYE